MNHRIEQEIQHGKNIARRAESIWGWESPAGRMRSARRADLFITLGNITRGARVLEMGCGTGHFTSQLARTRAEITAIDISPDLIERARANVRCPNVDFHVLNAEKTDLSGGTFDAVVGSSVLHHLDVTRALHEIGRVLKQGGKIVFTEPNMLNPQIFLQKNVKCIGRLMGDTPTESAFVRMMLRSLLKDAGFSSISVEPFDFLHPWTPRPLLGFVHAAGLAAEKIPLLREIAGSLAINAIK